MQSQSKLDRFQLTTKLGGGKRWPGLTMAPRQVPVAVVVVVVVK